MTPKQFMEKSVALDMPDLNYAPVIARLDSTEGLLRILHASVGMSGETGEILDTLKKSMMYGKPLDAHNLKKECGDVLWYMAIMLNQLDSSFEEVMQMNVDKLAKRYPSGTFKEADAIARKDANE